MSISHDRIGRSRAPESLITKIEESSWQISDIDIAPALVIRLLPGLINILFPYPRVLPQYVSPTGRSLPLDPCGSSVENRQSISRLSDPSLRHSHLVFVAFAVWGSFPVRWKAFVGVNSPIRRPARLWIMSKKRCNFVAMEEKEKEGGGRGQKSDRLLSSGVLSIAALCGSPLTLSYWPLNQRPGVAT